MQNKITCSIMCSGLLPLPMMRGMQRSSRKHSSCPSFPPDQKVPCALCKRLYYSNCLATQRLLYELASRPDCQETRPTVTPGGLRQDLHAPAGESSHTMHSSGFRPMKSKPAWYGSGCGLGRAQSSPRITLSKYDLHSRTALSVPHLSACMHAPVYLHGKHHMYWQLGPMSAASWPWLAP